MASEFLKELAKSDVKIDRIDLRSLQAMKKSNAQKRWQLKEALRCLRIAKPKKNLKHL